MDNETPRDFANRIFRDEGLAVIVLLHTYDCQTSREKRERLTIYENWVGFDIEDAPILTEIAERYLQSGTLTSHEGNVVRHRCRKYAGQYLDYIDVGPAVYPTEA